EPNASKRYMQARNKLGDDMSALVAAPLWRNFLAKYPESNGLQKRMLIVSEELARRSILDASAEVRQAQQNLWRAQGNDVYWHGVFGGIYFPHLRADAYASLLKAERILSERRAAAGEQRDYDVDGYDEYSFRSGRSDPVLLHAIYYQLTPQREARTVSLILEPPQRALASVPGLGIRKDIRIADEGLAAGVRYRLRNEGEERIVISFTSASNIGLLSEQNPMDTITAGTKKTTAGKPLDARNVTDVAVHSESRHFDIAFAIDPP